MALKGHSAEYLGDVLLRLPFRFVSDTDECILWPTTRNWNGYGSIRYRGKIFLAHRIIWEKANGQKIPAGALIMHTCDTPRCVNPRHLRVGSHKENVRDCNEKGRRNTPRGTKCGQAKLTDQQVTVLRESYRTSPQTHERLAQMFGVTRKAISEALHGHTWAHVPGRPLTVVPLMPRGQEHSGAKLTESQVREIRQRRANGEQGKDLAPVFGVSDSTICSVTMGKSWKHVEPASASHMGYKIRKAFFRTMRPNTQGKQIPEAEESCRRGRS